MRIRVDQLEKEIETCQRIIEQLQQCLNIFKKSNRKEYIKETIQDVEVIQFELKRLILEKESLKNDVLKERSSKAFS